MFDAGAFVSTGGFGYARWFRVISADVINQASGTQQVTLADAEDWHVLPTMGNPTANPTQLWVFDGVIAVFQKPMYLDLQ